MSNSTEYTPGIDNAQLAAMLAMTGTVSPREPGEFSIAEMAAAQGLGKTRMQRIATQMVKEGKWASRQAFLENRHIATVYRVKA